MGFLRPEVGVLRPEVGVLRPEVGVLRLKVRGSVSLETWISGHFALNQNGPEMHAVNELKLRLDNRVLIILHHST